MVSLYIFTYLHGGGNRHIYIYMVNVWRKNGKGANNKREKKVGGEGERGRRGEERQEKKGDEVEVSYENRYGDWCE